MMSASRHLAAPIPTQLPELKPGPYLTETQWRILLALIDAVVPSIVVESRAKGGQNQLRISSSQCAEAYERTKRSMKHSPDYETFQQYLEARPLDNPRFLRLIKATIQSVPLSTRNQLGTVLSIIATRLGSLAGTGYYTPLPEQPVHIREAILQTWNQSWLSVWPIIGKSILTIARSSFAQTDPLLLKLLGYNEVPESYEPAPSFQFDFMQFDAGSEIETVDTDAVIVGSGCGGAVCAKVLAEAGHRVVVVDKGYHFPTTQLPLTSEVASQFFYEGQGSLQSADGSVTIMAGSCWGGGGSVNWSVSLHTQGFVRQEWADQGLDFFTTQEYQQCLDRVCEFMGVSDAHIRHNHRANVILNGSKKLGWAAKACPQNTGGAEHYCGNCTLGCSSDEKQGPTASWLPAAARAGAKFIEGFNVSKVLFDKNRRSKKAVGVLGTWTSRDKNGNIHTPESDRIVKQIRVRAKKVIVACGTLHSPLVLMRSGLKNPHIGKNLHMHPVGFLNASFDEDIKGWEGGILTSVCDSFENLDGKGHGVKLEPTSMIPYMFLFEHPWRGALQWKLDALRGRQMDSFIAIARDRDTGRVYADPADPSRPVVDYTPSARDRRHILAGLVALAKLCYVEGATEIWPFVQSVPSFARDRAVEKNGAATPIPTASEDDAIDRGVNDPAFAAWLRKLEAAESSFGFPGATFTSAHQMGTCRMAARPASGVVDPAGRVWEARDLYVADASVFPSASGVNPMVTNMAIADWIARGISRDLKRAEGRAKL
ncbi:long-chain fatty alcohol dehydrogenase [Hypoxylon sp. FL1284]|nr:long-chain fatty alcohol dehydrogenase [Hypoxylon sp. FL1284]